MAGPISLSLSTKTMRVIVVEATKGSICQPTASVRLSPADLRNVRILAGLMRDMRCRHCALPTAPQLELEAAAASARVLTSSHRGRVTLGNLLSLFCE
jgi:hypothetical protein